MAETPVQVVILAAGQGKRMHSNLPKVLHPVAGKPLVQHVIDTARTLAPAKLVVVYGHGGEVVRSTVAAPDVSWARQEPQLGTGHAVAQALPALAGAGQTLVLYGDVPLTLASTLKRLLQAGRDGLSVLTMELSDPTGYGRIVRDGAGNVRRIVEEKDATPEEKAIREVNTGIMAIPSARLGDWLGRLSNTNAQGEYYLTDIVALAVAEGIPVRTAHPDNQWEVLGVNSKVQLAELERVQQRNLADAMLVAGVRLADPHRIDVRGDLTHGRDVFIDVGCVFEGRVELGDAVEVGPYCVLKDVKVGAGAQIAAFCHFDDATIGPDAAHRIPLNRQGRAVQISPARMLAGGLPEGVDDVVVMLDGKQAFASIDPAGLDIYWGAYLGTPEQLLVSGPLGDVAEEIIRVRADAAARLGWVFDTYLLRRRDREPARGG